MAYACLLNKSSRLRLAETSIRLLTKNNTKSVQHNLEKHIKIHNKTVSKALEN